MTSTSYVVRPVDRTLRLLAYVAGQPHEVSLTEVATALDLPKTSAFRYLQTLVAAGMIDHDAARDRYAMGEGFRRLARQDLFHSRLRAAARIELADLAARFAAVANLGALIGDAVVYVDIQEPPGRFAGPRPRARIGQRHPAHATALGKAITAFRSAAPGAGGALDARTWRTVTDPSALRRQIAAARDRGYAIEKGENEDGQTCIGAPILDAGGVALAALSLTGPEARISRDLDAAAGALRAAAQRIAASLARAAPAESPMAGQGASGGGIWNE